MNYKIEIEDMLFSQNHYFKVYHLFDGSLSILCERIYPKGSKGYHFSYNDFKSGYIRKCTEKEINQLYKLIVFT